MKGALLELDGRDVVRLPSVIASRTRREGDCLLWTGKIVRKGYGSVVVRENGKSRTTGAHRAAWLLAHGPITDPDLVLDHLCRNHACVNVDHLELVTNRENTLRGEGRGRRNIVLRPHTEAELNYVHSREIKTHCLRGHPMSDDNVRLYINPKTGYLTRYCLACRRRHNKTTSLATAGE